MSPEYTLRIAGLGRMGMNGGPRGELHVRVNIKPDAKFSRSQDDPNDLRMELPVSFVQLCLGDSVSVEMIDGTSVEVQIPAGCPNGHTLMVAGQGVPSLRRAERGNLWLRLAVQVPKFITAEQRVLLSNFDTIERGKNVHKDNSGPVST
jgi:molecular chaperone DnaJ